MNRPLRALFGAGLLLLGGCSTIETMDDKGLPFGFYSGTKLNVECWGPVERHEDGSPKMAHQGLRRVVSIVDFPWSLVMDTVLLPLSVPVELLR